MKQRAKIKKSLLRDADVRIGAGWVTDGRWMVSQLRLADSALFSSEDILLTSYSSVNRVGELTDEMVTRIQSDGAGIDEGVTFRPTPFVFQANDDDLVVRVYQSDDGETVGIQEQFYKAFLDPGEYLYGGPIRGKGKDATRLLRDAEELFFCMPVIGGGCPRELTWSMGMPEEPEPQEVVKSSSLDPAAALA